MSMLDRRSRSRTRLPKQRVPDSAGPDEETVRLVVGDLRERRRRSARAGRRRVVRRLLVALLVVGLVAAGVWAVYFSPYLATRGVEVRGNALVGTVRIERAARVPLGEPLARVDLGGIARRVERIPAVRSAVVSRSWPDRVRVRVTEREAVAVVQVGGALQSLDAEGVAFGSVGTRPRGLPLLRTKDGATTDAVAEGAKVVASMPPAVAARVDTIDVRSVDRITLNLRGGRTVEWGSAEDSTQKGQVLAVLLAQPGRTIDVSVPARPTTR